MGTNIYRRGGFSSHWRGSVRMRWRSRLAHWRDQRPLASRERLKTFWLLARGRLHAACQKILSSKSYSQPVNIFSSLWFTFVRIYGLIYAWSLREDNKCNTETIQCGRQLWYETWTHASQWIVAWWWITTDAKCQWARAICGYPFTWTPKKNLENLWGRTADVLPPMLY